VTYKKKGVSMAKVSRFSKRVNRMEKLSERRSKLEYYQKGSGLYVYRNRTNATLMLPKPTPSGVKSVEPGKEWQGDDYYMKMIGEGQASLVRVIVPPTPQNQIVEEKEDVMPEKLILDQPDQITTNGKVEHVVVTPETLKMESNPVEEKKREALINEDPMEGIQILLNE